MAAWARAFAASALAWMSSRVGRLASTSAGMSRFSCSLTRHFWRSLSARSSSRSFEKRDFAFALRSRSAA